MSLQDPCSSRSHHFFPHTTWQPRQDRELSSPSCCLTLSSQGMWHPRGSQMTHKQMIRLCRNAPFHLIYTIVLAMLFGIKGPIPKIKPCQDKNPFFLFFHCRPAEKQTSVSRLFFTHLGTDRPLLVPCLVHSVLQNNILFSSSVVSFAYPASAYDATDKTQTPKTISNMVPISLQYSFRNAVLQCLQIIISYLNWFIIWSLIFSLGDSSKAKRRFLAEVSETFIVTY